MKSGTRGQGFPPIRHGRTDDVGAMDMPGEFRRQLLCITTAGLLVGAWAGFLLVESQAGIREGEYQVVEVADAGSIVGEVLRPSGEKETEEIVVNKDFETCGMQSRRIDWVRAKEGLLLDTVVF